MMKVRILDRCEFYEENQISSRFNQKKIQFEWIFEVSAAGLEPATNGLKGQSPLCASPIQEPTLFTQSIG
ncbi:MAG: hypothetical protein MUO57_15645 [Anaerolineales bacterium]|nr:hypothetical protein [Anaerolineales bacterium]